MPNEATFFSALFVLLKVKRQVMLLSMLKEVYAFKGEDLRTAVVGTESKAGRVLLV